MKNCAWMCACVLCSITEFCASSWVRRWDSEFVVSSVFTHLHMHPHMHHILACRKPHSFTQPDKSSMPRPIATLSVLSCLLSSAVLVCNAWHEWQVHDSKTCPHVTKTCPHVTKTCTHVTACPWWLQSLHPCSTLSLKRKVRRAALTMSLIMSRHLQTHLHSRLDHTQRLDWCLWQHVYKHGVW